MAQPLNTTFRTRTAAPLFSRTPLSWSRLPHQRARTGLPLVLRASSAADDAADAVKKGLNKLEKGVDKVDKEFTKGIDNADGRVSKGIKGAEKRFDKATSKIDDSLDGFIGKAKTLKPNDTAANVFLANTIALAALPTAPALFITKRWLETGLNATVSAQAVLLFRSVALHLLLPVVTFWLLRNAAKEGKLGAPTYQALSLGILGFGAASVYVFASPVAGVMLAKHKLASTIHMALITLSGAYGFAEGTGRGFHVPAIIDAFKEAASSLTKWKDASGAAFSVISFLLAGLCVLILAFPTGQVHASWIGNLPPAPELARYSYAATLPLWVVVAYLLKEASDRGGLGIEPFKTLNLAFAAINAALLGMLAPAVYGWFSHSPPVAATVRFAVAALAVATSGYHLVKTGDA